MSQRFKSETPSSTATDDNVWIDDLRERDNAERNIPIFLVYEFCNKTHDTLYFSFSLESHFCCLYEMETSLLLKKCLKMLNRLFSELIWPRAESWWMRGFSGWSELIFCELRNVLLEFISEVAFQLRPLPSALNYFREFKSLDSGLFLLYKHVQMHFVFYPYLYVNHCGVNAVYDHLNSK